MSRRAKRQRPQTEQRPVLHAPPPPPPEVREPEQTEESERGVAVIDFYL